MSRDISIFVHSDEEPADFKDSMENLLSMVFEPDQGHPWALYKSFDPERGWVCIETHSFLNDPGLAFDEYPYRIEVLGPYNWSTEEGMLAHNQFAETIFGKLKSSRRYRLMMVENLEIRLDLYSPDV